MHNFKDIHPNVLKAFTKELDAPHTSSIQPRLRNVQELEAELPVILTDFQSAQEFISEGDTGAETVADFEGWISRHYEVLIQLPRAIDASWRVFMCTLCACMMRLYAFPELVRRLRQGLPTDPRPWADLWLTPTANFPVLLARSNLKTTRLPRSAVNPTGSLYEKIWAVYLDIWAAHSPEYAEAKGYTLVAPQTTSVTMPNVPSQTSQAPPATPAPNPTIAPAARAPSLISMDAVEEGSARTKPSKGKNREVIDLSGGSTSGSVPSTAKAPAPSIPPPAGNFEGVVLETPRNRKCARLETGNISDGGVEILDQPVLRTIVSRPRGGAPKTLTRAPKPPATPSLSKAAPTSSPSTAPSSPTSQLARAPMPAAAAPRAVAPSASQPSAPVAATNAPAAAAPAGSSAISAAVPHGGVPDYFLRLVPGKPWAKYLGAAITPPCGRCAISGASGRSSRAEDLGPCIAPGPGQPCNHCTRDKQKCTFTLPTEDRNIVANNAYLAGTMSPAAIVEGAERVARHAQIFALMEQTAYAMAAEGLAEQRKFLSNLRRAEHMMGKEAVIEQLFGSEELYEDAPLPNFPLVDVVWFAEELLDVQASRLTAARQQMEEEEVLEARVQEEVEHRLAAMSVGGATVAPAPVAPANEPSSVSAPSVAGNPASAGLGALAEYADSPPNSDQEMDTSK
ncbi:hypothetical protein BKA70DRAFT_1453962 [Coprinopsis sp. MPI-PUGE-AT-0042]|nr:hypothetical protein BKA70DRAFT_1453962 [Coprinopsis sp. MPI-PUGE-AT-0042]